MISRRVITIWCLVLSLCLYGHWAQANGTSIAETYDISNRIINELTLIERNAGITASQIDASEFVSDQPRHIVQEAFYVTRKFTKLRQLNWLPAEEISVFPVHYVWPDDVAVLLQRMLMGTKDLRTAYGVADSATAPTIIRPTTIKPRDIYHNLRLISHMINDITRVEETPSNGFRLVSTLNNDLYAICMALNSCPEQPATIPGREQSPSDVYEKLYDILEILYATQQSLHYTDKVVLPPKVQGRIIPMDVHHLASYILAETGELKRYLHIDTPAYISEYTWGKTPADVYEQVNNAKNTIQHIQTTLLKP